ncbi:ArsR/SmtB family transcription factor [Providencia vermicola]|uniref:ArsR/SmtB family transcription factor n=1 Tax=Providencia TaxID=586 RepID=UPI0012B57A17|nr:MULTISPECIES: winged helix-turn-helix domain-containing protein [Providencia]MTB38715.1 ArsR family transcriptional regulator [Providencia sp. wls1949]MTC08888.1 ArsR family transcriptional regulator [Providencia sp. wls1948]WBA57989.1 winged helix-turn-helix domain-containing protein [Providencia sp. 21OH12SH02B-Prov]
MVKFLIQQNMTFESAIAAIGAAMSDISRVKILCALMDGRAWTATELSSVADISASTASSHLSKLVDSRLIIVIAQGRHRYFQLAGKEIAELIESMMGISLNYSVHAKISTPVHLRKARICYDHLAGEIAVKIYDFLCHQQWITENGEMITLKGIQYFHDMGIDLPTKYSRKVCCACLDWSERRFHLGGYIGAALFTLYQSKGWLTRHIGYREVTINEKGYAAFKTHFGI